MRVTHLHKLISEPRYKRYLSVCGKHQKAIKLYRANIILSQKLFSLIAVFEVILRNAIDKHMSAEKGSSWLEDSASPGGYLDTNKGCEDSYHYVQQAMQSLGKKYCHNSLIAKLTLGFWKHQFGPKEYSAAGSTLISIFYCRPHGTKQKDILQKLTQINELRNRIAHHEPICFERDKISTSRAKRRYETIIELLQWLGCDHKKILYGIDGVIKSIESIEKI